MSDAVKIFELGRRSALHEVARLVDGLLASGQAPAPSVRARRAGQRGQRPRDRHLRLVRDGAA